MRLDTWTLGMTALRATLPLAAFETTFRPADLASLAAGEASHNAFRRLTFTPVHEPSSARLLGIGLPFLPDIPTEDFVVIVVGAGVATLLLRGIYNFLSLKSRPFGELSKLNDLVHGWAVTDTDDARAQAKRLGDAFLAEVKARRNVYDNKHFQVSWKVDPRKWAQREDIRQRLTTRYAKEIGETFQQFARGLSILSQGEWGNVYKEVFGSFMSNVALAMGPITRWQPPLTDEDEANFRHFQKVLRREVLALEMKLETLSEPHMA